MYPIKQSTAITVPFFVHDANGDAVTGLTDGSFTKRISKNGAAFGAMTVTISEMENGWYSIPLSTAHSDTLGLLTIVFTNGGAKQVNLQYRVHARLPDDLAFPTTSGNSIDVTATGAVGIDWGNVENAGSTVDLAATDINLVDTASALTTNNDKTGYSISGTKTTLDALNDLSAAQVNTEVDNALDTAIPVTPTADSINERVKRLEEDVTPTRAANLDNLDAAVSTRSSHGDPDPSGFLDAAISSRATPAQVNIEVLDVLNTDTFAEPGQAAPPATTTIITKINYLYKLMRNRITSTSTTISVFNDAGTVVDQKSTHSDDGTTYDRGKFLSGP